MELLSHLEPCLSKGGSAVHGTNQPLDLSEDASKKKGFCNGDSSQPNSRLNVEDANQRKQEPDAHGTYASDSNGKVRMEAVHVKSDLKGSAEYGNIVPADKNSCMSVKDSISLVSEDLQLVEIPVEKVMSECRVSSYEIQKNEESNELTKDLHNGEENFGVKTGTFCLKVSDKGREICENTKDEGDFITDAGTVGNVLFGRRKRGRPKKIKEDLSQCLEPPAAKQRRPVRKKVLSSSLRNSEMNGSLSQTCVGCGEWFKTQTQLDKHELLCEFLMKHCPKRLVGGYTCPVCSLDCSNRLGLKRHLIKMHPKSDSFICPFCNVQLGPVHNYVQHFHAHVKSQDPPKIKNPSLASSKLQNQNSKIKTLDDSLPQTVPNFLCSQCNKAVKNDHSLAVHLLWHNASRGLKVEQESITDVSSLGSYFESLNEFRVFKESKSQPLSLSPESFPSVSSDLVRTINHSFEYVLFTLDKLNSALRWNENGTPPPKCTTDLIEKLNSLSVMSSSVSEISKCLSKLIEKGGQLDENPLSKMSNDDGENLFVKVKEEVLEEDTANDSIENGLDCDSDPVDQPKTAAISDYWDESLSSSRSKKPKEFKCNICGQVLSSAGTLKRHNSTHEDAKPHKCKICSKVFRQKHHLKKHYSVHSVAGKFQCSLCEFSVKKIRSFLKHLTNEHHKVFHGDYDSGSKAKTNPDSSEKEEAEDSNFGDQEMENNEFEKEDKNDKDWIEEEDDEEEEEEDDGDPLWTKTKSFCQKRSIKKETPYQSTTGPFTCDECGVKVSHQSSFLRHKMIHENRKPYQCQECHKVFRRKHQLTRHGMVHSKRKNKHKCELCDFFTTTTTALERHILKHDTERIYSCETCGHKTKTIWQLAQHQKSHQPKKCKQCDYVAKNILDLRIHQRKNHLTLTCSECDYACSTNWQLSRHKKTHNKESSELFFCEHCGFSCTTKRQFSYHMIRHSNKTPFSCSQCDYKCSSRSSLSAHRLMHAGLKPFLCSFCGMSFRRSSHLNNHLLIHKDEKAFVCRTCGHPFRTRHNLKVHEMIHTGEKHHKCHLCPFACRRNKELRLHLEKHAAATDIPCTDTTFIVPKPELKIDEENAIPQEIFTAMFQVS